MVEHRKYFIQGQRLSSGSHIIHGAEMAIKSNWSSNLQFSFTIWSPWLNCTVSFQMHMVLKSVQIISCASHITSFNNEDSWQLRTVNGECRLHREVMGPWAILVLLPQWNRIRHFKSQSCLAIQRGVPLWQLVFNYSNTGQSSTMCFFLVTFRVYQRVGGDFSAAPLPLNAYTFL